MEKNLILGLILAPFAQICLKKFFRGFYFS